MRALIGLQANYILGLGTKNELMTCAKHTSLTTTFWSYERKGLTPLFSWLKSFLINMKLSPPHHVMLVGWAPRMGDPWKAFYLRSLRGRDNPDTLTAWHQGLRGSYKYEVIGGGFWCDGVSQGGWKHDWSSCNLIYGLPHQAIHIRGMVHIGQHGQYMYSQVTKYNEEDFLHEVVTYEGGVDIEFILCVEHWDIVPWSYLVPLNLLLSVPITDGEDQHIYV